MHTTMMRNASAIALLAALACVPVSDAYGQSANASDRGQEMGQGTPGGSNPNAGPGNNSGNGNSSPGSVGAAASGNANAGPGNNSGGGTGAGSTAGPEGGHNCGGKGHIDNDAPGHQHDDCHVDAVVTGALPNSEAKAQGTAAGQGKALPQGAATQASAAATAGLNKAAAATNAFAGGSAATADCSTFTETLVPIFGMFTEQESQAVVTADTAALIPVACAATSTDADAQRLIAANPAIVNALRAEGYSLSQVITVQTTGEVPTIYVEALAD